MLPNEGSGCAQRSLSLRQQIFTEKEIYSSGQPKKEARDKVQTSLPQTKVWVNLKDKIRKGLYIFINSNLMAQIELSWN